MILSPPLRGLCFVKQQFKHPGWANNVSYNELLWQRGPRPGDLSRLYVTCREPGTQRPSLAKAKETKLLRLGKLGK